MQFHSLPMGVESDWKGFGANGCECVVRFAPCGVRCIIEQDMFRRCDSNNEQINAFSELAWYVAVNV